VRSHALSTVPTRTIASRLQPLRRIAACGSVRIRAAARRRARPPEEHRWSVAPQHRPLVADVRSAVVGIELVTIVVDEYDPAISFFVDALDFELIEDSPSLTNDGRPKRWVVVRPRGESTGILLARADGDTQAAVVGNQTAGRVGFFLRVDDFDTAFRRMTAYGVEFVSAPRREAYGAVAVFRDIAGNRWDLLGPS
jgi:catechol 2,3-dioxygenase-like lactoylglutathione lyase family enzyme